MRKTPWILTALLLSTNAIAADFAGTWKLNLEKSKTIDTKITSETMTIQKTGPDSFRTTIDVTLKSGGKSHQEIDRIYDGKEHPSEGVGVPSNESEICETAESGERIITQKRNGKVLLEIKSSVSADGRTMTNTRSGIWGHDVLVFDRQ